MKNCLLCFYCFSLQQIKFIHILKMLLRKVERLDSMIPWQPFGNGEGATFYPDISGEDNRNFFTTFPVAFSIYLF